MANKRLLYTIAGLISVVLLITYAALSEAVSNSEGSAQNEQASPTETPASTQPTAEQTKSLDQLIIGSWVEAPTGGADGKTSCNDFSGLVRLNEGQASLLTFNDQGRVALMTSTNPDFRSGNVDAITVKNNQGSWRIEEGVLYIDWTGGTFGGEEDLPPGQFSAGLQINGNEMIHTFDSGQSRLVRCRE